jgi:hypothetical protein
MQEAISAIEKSTVSIRNMAESRRATGKNHPREGKDGL